MENLVNGERPRNADAKKKEEEEETRGAREPGGKKEGNNGGRRKGEWAPAVVQSRILSSSGIKRELGSLFLLSPCSLADEESQHMKSCSQLVTARKYVFLSDLEPKIRKRKSDCVKKENLGCECVLNCIPLRGLNDEDEVNLHLQCRSLHHEAGTSTDSSAKVVGEGRRSNI